MVDTIVVGRRVRTLAPETPDQADAVAITAGRITAIGPRGDVLPLAAPATRVIAHDEATIIPGLVDAHSHPIYSLGIVRGLSLTGVHTYAELRAAIERGRAEQEGEEWFLAWGLDPTAFEGRTIGNAVLHEVLGADRPAYIKMFDAHSAIASASALSRAGIDAPITHPDGSGAAGDAEGNLTGHLIEFPTMEIVEKTLPAHGFDDRVAQLSRLLSDMAAVGITSAHVMDLQDDDALDLLAAIEASGDLPVRLRISPWVTPQTTDAEVAELIALQGRGGRRYRIEGVKFFIDGTVEGGTAWLSSPDSEGEGLSSTWVPAEAYAARIRQFHQAGVPTATHAIGDRGIRFAAETLAALPATGVPHRIEHIETVDDDVIALIGRSGIMASMQPTHCTHHIRGDGGDDWSRRLGPQRAAYAWRTADVRRSGATLALGSDWPVASFDPWEIMADARLRRRVSVSDSPTIGAEQQLTATEAIEGYTTHAHRSVGSDGGALVVGAPADLVVVDRDPLASTPEELLHARVLLTLVDGVPTHTAS
ncbi:amidohydrolase [Microbacterium sp.]|uniref:amidohydrolase n=1 Tax=Microbacterium sp. TaxID=51671 RepID=UPI0039E51AF4